MSKQEKKVNQDSMEEFLASVPDQVTESDDFQLAQKGLSYLQESTDYAQGTALVKGRKGLLWIALMAFIILVGVASILILALWPGSSQNMIYYDESLIYPEDNFESIADYNAAYHTNFLNMDAAENAAVQDCVVYRTTEDDSLAYIRENITWQSDNVHYQITMYAKAIAQELSILEEYQFCDFQLQVATVDVYYSAECIYDILYHITARFEYNQVTYCLTIDSIDENCLEKIVPLLLNGGK